MSPRCHEAAMPSTTLRTTVKPAGISPTRRPPFVHVKRLTPRMRLLDSVASHHIGAWGVIRSCAGGGYGSPLTTTLDYFQYLSSALAKFLGQPSKEDLAHVADGTKGECSAKGIAGQFRY